MKRLIIGNLFLLVIIGGAAWLMRSHWLPCSVSEDTKSPAPPLNDPNPEVRRSVMLAVVNKSEAMPTDDLLRWLHDPDAEVCRLCEMALRDRGLRQDQIKLGRLLTDDRPQTRLEVFEYLRHHKELDPVVWLQRLSRDPSDAIRAAAIRVAAEQKLSRLADRVSQMAQDDPSPTVRQMAKFYLSYERRRNPL